VDFVWGLGAFAMATRAVKRKKAAAAAAAVPASTEAADDGDDTTVQEDEEQPTGLGAAEDAMVPAKRSKSVKEEASNEGEEAEAGTTEANLATGTATTAEAAMTSTGSDEIEVEGVAITGESDGVVVAVAMDEEVVEEEVITKKSAARAKPKLLKSRNSATSEASAAAPARRLNTDFPTHLNPTDMADFDHFLFQLLASRAENGLSNFTVHKDEYPLLYAWLQFLKKEYKSFTTSGDVSQLNAQQVAVLESLHVPLTSRGDDHWNRFYDLLVAYKARHGHVLVPRLCEVPGLGDWVTDQRRQYKAKQQGQATQLTDPRQEKLDAIDFVWHVRNRPEWVRTTIVIAR
jgi:Helicase associated domain